MNLSKTTAVTTVALGAILAASAISLANPQQPNRPRLQAAPSGTEVRTVLIPGHTEWIQRANIAARQEGVIKQIEMTLGMEVAEGKTIATLDDKMAVAASEKARMVANDLTLKKMAEAERRLAMSNLVRDRRVNEMGKNYISKEELEISEAQFSVASTKVENEQAKLDQAQMDCQMAEIAVEHHRVVAPFAGEVIEVFKQPGEAVQSMEPVVQLARVDRVRFYGYVPLRDAQYLRKGMVVDVTPSIDGADLEVEQKRFRGRIVFIGLEVSAGRLNPEVLVKADIINNVDKELRVGYEVEMTVYLTNDPSKIPPDPKDMLNVEKQDAARLTALPHQDRNSN